MKAGLKIEKRRRIILKEVSHRDFLFTGPVLWSWSSRCTTSTQISWPSSPSYSSFQSLIGLCPVWTSTSSPCGHSQAWTCSSFSRYHAVTHLTVLTPPTGTLHSVSLCPLDHPPRSGSIFPGTRRHRLPKRRLHLPAVNLESSGRL